MINSKIEWTDATWNPVKGCTRISPGCMNCYAESQAARFAAPGGPFHLFADPERSGSKWTGKVEIVEKHLADPLKWRKPRRIFVNSMSDLFRIEDILLECVDAGVPVFIKQLGARPETEQALGTAPLQFRHPKGGDPAEWPKHLRIREFPEVRR